MGAGEREALEAAARPAVLVRRGDLPVPLEHPASSFFGGLPRWPSEFVWPRAEVRAGDGVETVALTFVAQIDLSELPASSAPLPRNGTLYFFSSSVFEDEGFPPRRVLYHPGSAKALSQAAPPPDLMVLAGGSGYQVAWLDPAGDFHAKVEFKYPLSFLPFRDFPFTQEAVGGELFARSLCEALGPGDPETPDLLQHRGSDDFAADADWPFNALLMAYVARSVLSHVKSDLQVSPYRKPLDDATKQTLLGFEARANTWLAEAGRMPAMQSLDASGRAAFRAWWTEVARAYEGMQGRVSTYPHQFANDVGRAIDHTIRYMSAHGDVARAPSKYVQNLQRRNRWKAPGARDAQYRSFGTAIHQIGGHGCSWQSAPEDHRDDLLLLQIQGDDAFLGWHENSGCFLHFWIGREALAARDFSDVEGTLECD